MDPMPTLPKPTARHKCPACYKQYKRKEHLIEHMRTSYHSVHQPKCGVCKKHCKTLESVREHVTGPLPKSNCTRIFRAQGCEFCLKIFDDPDAVKEHTKICRLSPPPSPDLRKEFMVENHVQTGTLGLSSIQSSIDDQSAKMNALECEILGWRNHVSPENHFQLGTGFPGLAGSSGDEGAKVSALESDTLGWENHVSPENHLQSGTGFLGLAVGSSGDQGAKVSALETDTVGWENHVSPENRVSPENHFQSGTGFPGSAVVSSGVQGAQMSALECEIVGWGNHVSPENHFQSCACFLGSAVVSSQEQGLEVVAMDCEMVGGGSDGSLDLCARVCLIDENENVLFHSFVEPQIPVTDYRYEITGLTEDYLGNAMPLKIVKAKVEELLYNGESIGRARVIGGKARVLVGHDLDHDLDCLKMNYPDHLIRDTAKYPPLMKTNLARHSLKYLTKTYLGYDIQSDAHDPYQDCVAALRIYKRMRSELHEKEEVTPRFAHNFMNTTRNNNFDSARPKDLEAISSDALLEMSCSNYRCWCLDQLLATKLGVL